MYTRTSAIVAIMVAAANAAKRAEFSSADLPKSAAAFGQFDLNGDGKIEPSEIYTAYKTMSESKTKKQAFMKAMDASLRKFCGVGPAPVKPT